MVGVIWAVFWWGLKQTKGVRKLWSMRRSGYKCSGLLFDPFWVFRVWFYFLMQRKERSCFTLGLICYCGLFCYCFGGLGFGLVLKHIRYSNIYCGHRPFTQETHGPSWVVRVLSVNGDQEFCSGVSASMI